MSNKEFLEKYGSPTLKENFDKRANVAGAKDSQNKPYQTIDPVVNKSIITCLKKVENAPDGEKHCTLRDYAFLFGRYVSGGLLSLADAKNMLRESIRKNPNNVVSLTDADKTIDKCLEAGKSYPISTALNSNDQNQHFKKLKDGSNGSNGKANAGTKKPSNNLSVQIGSEIIERNDIITYNQNLYIYESNYWKQIEDDYFDKEIAQKLGDKYSKTKLNDTKSYLKSITRTNEINVGIKRSELSLINGVLNLLNDVLQPHNEKTKQLFNTNLLEVNYDDNAHCYRWIQFLDEIFTNDPDKEEKIMLLQEFMGYCLTTDVSHQQALFLLGNGSNGKSIVLKVLQRILSKGNYSSIELHELTNKHYIIELENKLLNVCSEVDKSIIKTDIFKKIVSGDSLTGDKKFKDTITFDPYCKLIFAANELPAISDKSYGYFRRLIILKFNNMFEEKNQDKGLLKKLLIEKDGIFTWMITGLKRLNQSGSFTPVESSKTELDLYKANNNNIIAFVNEECTISSGNLIKYKDLYESYKNYCRGSGYKEFSKGNFKLEVVKIFPEVIYKRDGTMGHCFHNIKVNNDTLPY